jgi:hypothetical protein
MKYVPGIAAVLVQLGATIFFMEVVRRDLFMALGFATALGVAVLFSVHFIQGRIASRRIDT